MKQGTGRTSTETKREPISRTVSPGGASQIGIIPETRSKPLYEGRGVEAPKANLTVHESGSQGRHK